jgi:hypothetical protein
VCHAGDDIIGGGRASTSIGGWGLHKIIEMTGIGGGRGSGGSGGKDSSVGGEGGVAGQEQGAQVRLPAIVCVCVCDCVCVCVCAHTCWWR